MSSQASCRSNLKPLVFSSHHSQQVSSCDLDQFKAKLKNNNGPKTARLLNDREASKGVTNCQRRRFNFNFKVCQSVFFLFFFSLFPFLFFVSVFCFIRLRLETFLSCHCLFRVSSTVASSSSHSSSSSTLDICQWGAKSQPTRWRLSSWIYI